MSEAQRNALNALLFQTGEQSSSFMMVLATNRPGDLDTAVTDRVDEAFSFPLPGRAERAAMLRLYFHTYITATRRHGGGLWARLRHSRLLFGPFARVHSGIVVDGFAPAAAAAAPKGGGGGGKAAVTAAAAAVAAAAAAVPDELFVALAHELDGFSGREIAKLMISVQGAAYGSAAGRLTREMLLRVVQWKVQEHRAKGRMAKAGAAGLSY